MSAEMFNGIHVGQVLIRRLSISPHGGTRSFTTRDTALVC